MRTHVAILGLLLIALGWINAGASDGNPTLLFIGFALLLAAGPWTPRDIRVAAAALSVPVAYWLYKEGFYQPPICYEDRGCIESWLPPQIVRTALELVPYLVVAALAWRLGHHRSGARGRAVPAHEGDL